jgi:hypothetical protein
MILKVRSLHSTILWLAINKCGREFPFTTFRCRLLFFSRKDANHFIWDIGKLSFECRAYKRQLMMKTAFSKVWKLYGAFSKNSKRDGRVITELGHSFPGEQKREVCRQPNFISSFSATFSNVGRLRWYTKTTAVHKQELDVYPLPTWLMTWKKDTVHASQKRLFVPPV